jgi:hypothetical protein
MRSVVVSGSTTVEDQEFPSSVPSNGGVSASFGSLSAALDYDLSNGGFSLDPSQAVIEGLTSAAADIFFQVDEPTYYEASGSFAASDPEGRRISLFVHLLNPFTNQDLLNNFQQSHATPDEAFAVGGAGGDNGNRMFGSLTGTLQPGNTYQFTVVTSFHGGSVLGISAATCCLGSRRFRSLERRPAAFRPRRAACAPPHPVSAHRAGVQGRQACRAFATSLRAALGFGVLIGPGAARPRGLVISPFPALGGLPP